MFDADAPHTNVSYGMTSSAAVSGIRRGINSLAHGTMSLPGGYTSPASPRSVVSSPRGLARFPTLPNSKSLGSASFVFGRTGNGARLFNASGVRKASQNPSVPSGKKRDALSHITALAGAHLHRPCVFFSRFCLAISLFVFPYRELERM